MFMLYLYNNLQYNISLKSNQQVSSDFYLTTSQNV
jgi:hypothetical protein